LTLYLRVPVSIPKPKNSKLLPVLSKTAIRLDPPVDPRLSVVPVAAPMFGVIRVGVFAKTTAPVPVDTTEPVPPFATDKGVVNPSDVKRPVEGDPLPIGPGEVNVAPFNKLALRLGTLVVLETTSGAVPVATVDVSWPDTERLVPVAAPMIGVTRVGDVASTTPPVPTSVSVREYL
jgi:hypothetical protein